MKSRDRKHATAMARQQFLDNFRFTTVTVVCLSLLLAILLFIEPRYAPVNEPRIDAAHPQPGRAVYVSRDTSQ